jgi:hypothetical protein
VKEEVSIRTARRLGYLWAGILGFAVTAFVATFLEFGYRPICHGLIFLGACLEVVALVNTERLIRSAEEVQ